MSDKMISQAKALIACPSWLRRPVPVGFRARLFATAIAAAATASLVIAGAAGADAARITSERYVDARVVELTISTPAFTAPTHVDVDLPVGYNTDPARRWPVTYYLAGTNHVFSDFNNAYEGEKLTAGFPSIVVSPNGDSGYWSDWYNGGRFGPPMYETFVIDQLIPLIDRTFRTIPKRSQRAVMGESMGGYGTMMYAAEHPDLFAAAASLSGAVDTDWQPQSVVTTASPALQEQPPDSIYGPFATQAVRWHGHNPTDLAENLADVDLQIRSAMGALTPSDLIDGSVAGCGLEVGVHTESVDLHNALDALGIPSVFHVYAAGCHNVALFEQEISDSIPEFEEVFAHPRHAPASFDYESIEPRFEIWGWHVTADPKRALEFMQLRHVSRTGLTLTGTGTTTVTTPPLFGHAKAVRVIISGQAPVQTIKPGPDGSLRFTVKLGVPDQDQQYTLGAATNLTTRSVHFHVLRRPHFAEGIVLPGTRRRQACADSWLRCSA